MKYNRWISLLFLTVLLAACIPCEPCVCEECPACEECPPCEEEALCVDFDGFAAGVNFGHFVEINEYGFFEQGGYDLTIVETNGERVLQFLPPEGIMITLPTLADEIQMRVLLADTQLNITVEDSFNNVIASETVPGGDFQEVTLTGDYAAQIWITEGGGEGYISYICITPSAPVIPN